jgi:hypothetical protein
MKPAKALPPSGYIPAWADTRDDFKRRQEQRQREAERERREADERAGNEDEA